MSTSMTKLLRTMSRQERARFLLKYAKVRAACFKVVRVDGEKFSMVRKGYYRSEEWKDA